MQASRAKLEKSRNKLVNTMKFSAHVLGSPLTRIMLGGLVSLPRPLQDFFATEQEQLKTKWGTLQLMLALQQNSFECVLHSLLSRFTSFELAKDMGVFSKVPLPPKVIEQAASAMWRLTYSATGSLAIMNMTFVLQPPFAFLGLLSADSGVVDSTIAFVKRMWGVVMVLEKLAQTNAACDKFLVSLRWPQDQFSRELFILLLENSWSVVPELVKRRLREFAEGYNSTLLVENMFRMLRQVERQNMSGVLEPMQAWHEAHCSSLLAGYDRPSSAPTAAAKAVAPREVPRNTFDSASNTSMSLPDERFEARLAEPQPGAGEARPDATADGIGLRC